MRTTAFCSTLIAAITTGWLGAQNFCGSDPYNNHLKALHPAEAQQAQDQLDAEKNYFFQHGEGQRANATYVIPVVFHIIHDYGVENISDAQVLDAMAILNRDYAKLNPDTTDIISQFTGIASATDIEFRLATIDPNGNCTNGIEHIASKQTNNASDSSKLNPWPRNSYLNIWVVKNIGTLGVAAYATMPASVSTPATAAFDGIIMVHSYIGSVGTGSVTTCRFLTHEIGHYLGLVHTWGNTGGPNIACGDDGIGDTPITKGWIFCPSSSTALDICTPGVAENYQNYMETGYCMRMFTADQAVAMHATLNSTVAERDQLWTTANLIATGTYTITTANCAPKADFHATHRMVCEGDSMTFFDDSWNGTVTSRAWQFPGGTPSTSTLSNPAVNYNTAGLYPVTLTVSNTNGSGSLTKTGYIIVGNSYGEVVAPASEGFDSLAALNHGWHVINYANDPIYWHQANDLSGNGCVVLDNYHHAAGEVDDLISPLYDLRYMTGINLTFRVAFASMVSDTNLLTETLRVMASVNCGKTWMSLTTLRGGALLSAPMDTGYFIPYNDTLNWKMFTLQLSPSLAQARTRFKFEFTGGYYGNEFFLDDVNITGTNVGVNEFSNLASLDLFPNPAQENTTLQLLLKKKEQVRITLSDIDGRVLKVIADEPMGEGEHTVVIGTSELSSGMYFVTVDDGICKSVRKLSIKH